MSEIANADLVALQAIVAQMEAAWNAGDGTRFAACYAIDAEQVNIFGDHLRGRKEIADRHDLIFRTIFHGSRNTLRLRGARYLAPGVVVAQVDSAVAVAQGPLAGDLKTLASVVFRKGSAGWELALFHNTRIVPPALRG